MGKSVWKDLFREIKRTFGRFIAIFAIVAIGVAFFAGVTASSNDMKNSTDHYVLRPASGCFLYLVSKGCSVGCARNDNSVSFHHAMFAHQCRNSEKYGITNSLK